MSTTLLIDRDDDPRAQLAALDAEIARIEFLLASLVRRRVPLQRSVNRHCAPMLSLPVEICAAIFSLCFPPDVADWGPGTTPLVLGAVCTAWRSLAWDMPRLWNTVYLATKDPRPSHPVVLSEWIARAAHLPLSVTICLPPAASISPGDDIIAIMAVLAAHAARCCTLDLDVPSLFPPLPALPLLTAARVALSSPLPLAPLPLFLSAPSLVDLTLLNVLPSALPLPSSQITTLHIAPTTIQECRSILASFHALTHCTFSAITSSDVINPSSIHHPTLLSLDVTFHIPTPPSELIDALSFPALSRLALRTTYHTPFFSWSFVSFISRSACPLTHLTFSGFRLLGGHLFDCLRAVPKLTDLSLIDISGIDDSSFRFLNPYFINPPILPALTHFSVHGIFPPSAIVNVVETRCADNPPVVRLQKVVVRWHEPLCFPKILYRLRQLQSDSVVIELFSGDTRWT